MEKSFRPLSDQVLVKVLPFEEKVKSLWVPETVDHGRLPIRQGIVVALGCGDVVARRCPDCAGPFDEDGACDYCNGTSYLDHERTEFTVKVGDKVLFHPRYWAEVMIDGEPHIVVHEDQGILAVLEE